MATYAGDFNLDGSVDGLDVNTWTANFGIGTVWQLGDANYDGVVNGLDLDLVNQNSGKTPLAGGDLSGTSAGTTAKWTFMVYLDGDNNLEGAGIDDFLEMASAGSDANVNIVVQFDRAAGNDTSYGDWTDTRRGIIMPGNVPNASSGASIGEANMGDPTTLVNFVSWATSNYPADHYALVLWDHGGGWRSAGAYKSACWDDTSGGDYLENREVGTVLAAIPQNMDLFGYDCCLMAMLECAHQIRNEASVFVTSEETEPGDGWAYDVFLPHLKANSSWTAAQLGADVVTTYGNYYGTGSGTTQSATNLAVVGAPSTGLSATISSLATTIMANATAGDYSRLQTQRSNAPYFSDTSFRDLGKFLSGVVGDTSITASIRTAASNALTAYNSAIIANFWDPSKGATGLSIYFPDAGVAPDADYRSAIISFAGDTQWDEFLNWWAAPPPWPGQVTFYSNNLDSSPSWTVSGQWAFGHPTGQGGVDGGYPDPTSGATGTNVYGVNLNGDYNTAVGGPYYLTTSTINCSNYTNVMLDFQRWLNSNWGSYVSATIDVWNGSTWSNVFSSPSGSETADGSWQHKTVSISAYADGKSAVKIRWGYQVLQSSNVWSMSGWNIDDVKLTGIPIVNNGIAGCVWIDLDSDGTHDTGETGQSNWTVYIDANGNSALDGGEQSILTDSSGNYALTGLSAGTYIVREVLQCGCDPDRAQFGLLFRDLDVRRPRYRQGLRQHGSHAADGHRRAQRRRGARTSTTRVRRRRFPPTGPACLPIQGAASPATSGQSEQRSAGRTSWVSQASARPPRPAATSRSPPARNTT